MLDRRSLLIRSAYAGVGAALPFGLTACGGGNIETVSGTPNAQKDGARPEIELRTEIKGQVVPRQQVLEWEARRIQVVAQRMRGNLIGALLGDLASVTVRPAVDTSNIDVERELLADAKIRAGVEAMKRLIGLDLAITTPLSDIAAVGALGQWSVSETDLFSNRGTAEGFARWFRRKGVDEDDLRAMVVACPDHYHLRGSQPAFQEVFETVGGAIEASHFTINYNNTASLPIVEDEQFPITFNGAARNESGTVIGGTNHRLRNLDQGFQIRAAIFFPITLAPLVVAEHRMHLACEFSNWVTAYLTETGD